KRRLIWFAARPVGLWKCVCRGDQSRDPDSGLRTEASTCNPRVARASTVLPHLASVSSQRIDQPLFKPTNSQ
ncbi:hypothetical protein BaRGS_00007250, partial [Batillaria attramentaria]